MPNELEFCVKGKENELKKERDTFVGSILSYKLSTNKTRSWINFKVSGCLAE